MVLRINGLFHPYKWIITPWYQPQNDAGFLKHQQYNPMNGRWDLDLPPLAANRITVCRGQLCWGSSWMICNVKVMKLKLLGVDD